MPNVPNTLRNRKADKVHRDKGWGPLQTWPVPRGEDPPLVFQMRLPLRMELVDLDTLAESAPGAPESVARGVDEIAGVAKTAGLIVVGALREPQDDGSTEILATITAAFQSLAGPPDVDELVGDASDDVRPAVIEQLSDLVTRIDRLTRYLPPGEDEAHPHAIVQYLIQSRYGALVMAYATTHPGMIFGEDGRGLFLMITETGFIGERPQYS